jgi:hypothetical protein
MAQQHKKNYGYLVVYVMIFPIGKEVQPKKKVIADHELHQCVVNLGEPSIARLMLLGVRIGGSPYFPSSFRWGYGWPFPRGYQHLSMREKQQVVEQSKKIDLSLQQVIRAID